MMFISILSAVVSFAATSLAADASAWRSRSIYQVLTDRFARSDGSTTATCNTGDRTLCGGSWVGIANHLDYIQGMGFSAVWISPVTLNLAQNTGDGTAYHGYWQQDLYSLNSNFGTADDLRALASALHFRGMFLMVDIVVNHNGFAGSHTAVDYSVFHPFDQQSYYHPYCTVSDVYDQSQRENCWLGDDTVPLVDIATENPDVVNGYSEWITELVSNYSIDGLRIDTAMYVDSAFWGPFNRASGVFSTGEVSLKIFVEIYLSAYGRALTGIFKIAQSDTSFVSGYQNVMDSTLNYPIYGPLVAAFKSTSGDIGALANTVNSVKSSFKDSTVLGSFSENHDSESRQPQLHLPRLWR